MQYDAQPWRVAEKLLFPIFHVYFRQLYCYHSRYNVKKSAFYRLDSYTQVNNFIIIFFSRNTIFMLKQRKHYILPISRNCLKGFGLVWI